MSISFLDAGSAPAHHPLLVIAIGTRLHCPSAGFLVCFFWSACIVSGVERQQW